MFTLSYQHNRQWLCLCLLSWRLAERMKLARSDKVLALIVVIALIGIVVALVAALATQTSSEDIRNTTSKEDITNTTSTSAPPPPPATTTSSAPPSSTITSTSPATTTSPRKDRYDSVYKQYRYAAVTTDTNICSQIGALEYSLFLN